MRTISTRAVALTATLALSTVGLAAPVAAAEGDAVYTISNAAAGNELVVFAAAPDGSLTPASTHPTGGTGLGAGLGSQGAVTLADGGHTLFVVNAGSDDISVFDVSGASPVLTDVEDSQGTTPISVTVDGDRVAVLNDGSTDVATFRLVDGDLVPTGSIEQLSQDDADPAQVEFHPNGRAIVVTEKNTSRIVIYPVAADGTLGAGVVTDSNGSTPFGFAFDHRGNLVVSEAAAGALSSYRLTSSLAATVRDGSVPTTEIAACWVEVTDDGRYVYTTNTGTDSVTGYRLHGNGGLDILDEDGVTAPTGDAPTDMVIAGSHLYTLDSGSDQFSVFSIGADGSLSLVETEAGLPVDAAGVAAG